jgi:hypothetical protein
VGWGARRRAWRARQVGKQILGRFPWSRVRAQRGRPRCRGARPHTRRCCCPATGDVGERHEPERERRQRDAGQRPRAARGSLQPAARRVRQVRRAAPLATSSPPGLAELSDRQVHRAASDPDEAEERPRCGDEQPVGVQTGPERRSGVTTSKGARRGPEWAGQRAPQRVTPTTARLSPRRRRGTRPRGTRAADVYRAGCRRPRRVPAGLSRRS